MCARYTLYHSTAEIAAFFGVTQVEFDYGPRYNIAPTQYVPIVRSEPAGRSLSLVKWGLIPSWAKDESIGQKLINARAETIDEKPSFRAAFNRRRCLIPADGFYEWALEGGAKQPYRFHLQDDDVFAFAGLWDEWIHPDGSPIETCTIITVPSNDAIAPIHSRMPAILRRGDEAHWLDNRFGNPSDLFALLAPYPSNAIESTRVSRAVNRPTSDTPALITPVI
jgi:putative SOS response-associated peptidase YedK